MRLVRLLPDRWQKFVHEALKFGTVGGINWVINTAVFNLLAVTIFVDGQLKAAVVATLVATCTSYLMNRHWTYRDRPKSAMRREYALFFLFNASGLVIELGVLGLAKYNFGITGLLALNVAKILGVALATVFRFWSYRTFVFQSMTDVPVPVTGELAKMPTTGRQPRVREPEHARREPEYVVREPEHALLNELDPATDLAESVTELERAGHHSPVRRTDHQRTDRHQTSNDDPVTGRFARFARKLDTELAAELDVAHRRSTAR